MGREVRMMENCGMDKGLGIGGDPVFTSGPLVVQFNLVNDIICWGGGGGMAVPCGPGW